MRNALRVAVLTMAVVPLCLWAGSLQAGDYFFACATPGDGFFLEQGGGGLELYDGETRRDHQRVWEIPIHEREGVCTTPDGQAFDWAARSFLYELTIDIDGTTIELMFLCEEASSGVPASVQHCTESTTSDTRLEPAHTKVSE